MKVIIALLLVVLYSCHDMKVGYLEYENAVYSKNEMVVKKVLDPVEDADRIQRKYNWVSLPIEGIMGTQPIFISIHSVKTEDGDVEKFLENVDVRGNGTFDVPFENDIPVGTYVITLKVENEDHYGILPDIFTIIVK